MDALPAPMLPVDGRPPVGQEGWWWEFKFDGIRVLVQAQKGRWRLVTREGRDVTARFPELEGIAAVGDVVVDGELVVLAEEGLATDFGAAMSRLHTLQPEDDAAPVTVFAFDVLRIGGQDVRSRPYLERRAILESLDLEPGYWAVPPAFADGEATIATSLELGLEGVVAKRARGRYVSGRSRLWLKARHKEVLDMNVIGWRRRESGGLTLLLAEATSAGWRFTGRCVAPRYLIAALEPLAAAAPPVRVDRARGVQWVRPLLQVEVRVASREPDGRLRLPRFVRPRLDLLA